MRKRLLTLGFIFLMLLPILHTSQVHVLAFSEKSLEEQNAYQLNNKMLGGVKALATDEPAEYELLWEPNRAKAAYHAVALSPDKRLLAIGGGHLSGDNEIHLYYWTGQWTHIWSAGDGIIEGSVLALAIDDMDGDGFFEVVAGSVGGKIYVYALRTGNPDYIEQKAAEVYQLVWKSSNEITHRVWSIVIGDLDEDLIKEIIVGAGDGVHVFEYLTRSGYRNRLGYSQAFTEVWSNGNTVKQVRAVATGDTDGDGFQEIIAGSEDHRVYIFENTLDEWSAYPPHADNAYVLKWDSGRQIFGPIQALAVGDLNPTTPSDEIVVSAYGHGVFVFEKAADVQLVSTLLIAETAIVEATFLSPASQTLGGSAPNPNQVSQPITQPIVQPIVQPIESQPIVVQPVPIQPVLPIQPSQPIQLVEMPTGAPGLAVTYLKDRTMTMTKLFRPLEPWEAPEEYGGPPVPYPIDIYTDWATGSLGGVQDPYEGVYPLEANSAMTRKPDGILGRIPTEGSTILDFGQFETVTGGGNSAPDLTILLGMGPAELLYQAVGTLQPVESIIPVGQMQPLELVEPTATIAPIEPTELVVGGEVLPIEEIPQVVQSKADSVVSGNNRALSMETIQSDQIIYQPIFQPIFFQLSTPIEPVQTIQPFLTPYSPIRTVDAIQPISPSISKATPVSVTQIKSIQPLLPSDAIVDVLKKQSVEIAISQDGKNFTIIPSTFIKEAEWTFGSQRLTKLGMEVLPSYVIDIDPVLVATQWDSIRYLYIKNTGDVNIYVDTAYGILYRPLAETLSLHLTNMKLARPSGDIIPSEYDDQDVITLGTQDGRLIFYDYQGVQQAPRIYDTYEDSVFSLGTGIWNFISITDSPT
ncbi:MAG: hypothetical protein ACE5R6_03025 [Candidatus Heimdallarchaeota archaeon]